jgi:hypothetical protein
MSKRDAQNYARFLIFGIKSFREIHFLRARVLAHFQARRTTRAGSNRAN